VRATIEPLQRAVGLALLAAHLIRQRAWHLPPRDSVSLQQRLAALPVHGLSVRAAVAVHWDAHQIPFIEADSDADLATVLGAIHVHLRWTQMELMRRISQGRISEMIGPLGLDIDHLLRAVDFGRAVPRMIQRMPAETLEWVSAFVAGINRAIELAQTLPPEFALLGLEREAWSVEHVLTLGRLVSLDVTWFTWMGLLRHNPGTAAKLWQRVTQVGHSVGRMGSNSLAVAGSRTQSGAAWLASDPHLGAALPPPWLLAGYRSPSLHAVGLMIPGIPMLALGRNPLVAWGGTNLHAASSDLIDVTHLPANEITVRCETIRVRWSRPRAVTLRDTPHGPIVSDAPFLRLKRHVALRWIGHEASDELTAMLRINRARNWQEFRAASELFAVPGQNLLYADSGGHVGKVMAAWLPERAAVPSEPVMEQIDAGWSRLRTSATLPASFDPEQGFIASANERPNRAPIVIGYSFSPRTRFQRLSQLVTGAEITRFDTLRAAQLDITVQPTLGLRDLLVRALRQHTPEAEQLAALLAAWDGRYDADSPGALAFELLIFHLLTALRGKSAVAAYSRTWDSRALARADIEAAEASALGSALRRALPAIRRDLRRFSTWGGMHRLALPHALAMLPIFGRRYRFGNWPVSGSNEALLKTGHPLTDRRHFVGLVVTARHISDLADPDRNWFVLLGGQDGWLGSTTMLDQVPLWRAGEYVQIPLRPETVRAQFPFRTEFRA
jgi:penicillin G amidase